MSQLGLKLGVLERLVSHLGVVTLERMSSIGAPPKQIDMLKAGSMFRVYNRFVPPYPH
jgi:hypothetical protein